MPSKPFQIVQALFDLFSASEFLEGVTIGRNMADPEEIASGDKIINIMDPRSDEDAPVLGGFRNKFYSADIDIAMYVAAGTDEERDELFDGLIVGIGQTIESDRFLGGLVEGLDYTQPSSETGAVEGGASIKYGMLVLNVDYQTATPVA